MTILAVVRRFFRALGEAFTDVWLGDDDEFDGERR
jgi:hypothetical protein